MPQELEQENWTDLHPDFADFANKISDWGKETKTYQELWKSQGFSKEQARQYLKGGFNINDYMFIAWLRDHKKLLIEKISEKENNLLRKEYKNTWTKLDDRFSKLTDNRTYQENWEKCGINYQEASEWIKLGTIKESYYICWPWRWIKKAFDYQSTKEWKEALKEKFTISDSDFCVWLRDEKNLSSQEVKKQSEIEIENLVKEYNSVWVDIHEDFSKKHWSSKKTYQEKWQDTGLTYQDAQEWIRAGFKVPNYNLIKQWKNLNFFPQRVKEWINIGLKFHEVNFAFHLQQKKHQPNQLSTDNLFSLRVDFYPKYPHNQGYLDKNYPCNCNKKEIYSLGALIHEQKCLKNILELDLRNLDLVGDLDLEEFPINLKVYLSGNYHLGDIKNKPYCTNIVYQNPLEWLNHQYNNKNQVTSIDLADFEQLSELFLDNYQNLKEIHGWRIFNISKITISNCPKLERIYVNIVENNQSLTLCNLPNLKYLHFCESKLTTLDLTDFSNLQAINCFDNLLTEIKLPNPGKKLEILNLGCNEFKQDLVWLNHLANLNEINLNNNHFYGSLEYLKNMNKLEVLGISNTDLDSGLDYLPDSLKQVEYSTKERPNCKLVEIIQKIDNWIWKDLHSDFAIECNELFRKKWEKQGFTKEQTKEWIQIGIEPKDYGFVSYLRDVKKITPQEFLIIQDNKETYQNLKEMCNRFNWCRQCQQPNTSENWCQPCEGKDWQRYIKQLTGKELVEKFIQQQQFKQIYERKKLRWIPYENFEVEKDEQGNNKVLVEGGFSKIYKAKWINKYYTDLNEDVVLKILNDSQKITFEFLTEVANSKLVDRVVECYGLSQDPITNNYIMIMEYVGEGNLRQRLQNKNSEVLSISNKFFNLLLIVEGLERIHDQDLIHRDLHSGNILVDSLGSRITDLGLSQTTDYQKEDGKIFGVLPYVAPEILQGQTWTFASDVYSFGVIAYELFSNTYPYADIDLSGVKLASEVCRGLRPNIDKFKIPQLLKNLIKSCWDNDWKKRPKAKELSKIINVWWNEAKNGYFYQQLEETEDEYNDFSQNTPYQIHPNTITHSQSINTVEIAHLFQESQAQEALELEIKKIEQEINQPLDEKLKKLVSDFIQLYKERERGNKNIKRKDIKNLKDKLRAEKLAGEDDQNIEKIINYCVRLVKLEQEKEQEQLQANVEVKALSR